MGEAQEAWGGGRRRALLRNRGEGGSRLEEEERLDKRARPVSERGEGEGEVGRRWACWA
jgi:hypothetical protein